MSSKVQRAKVKRFLQRKRLLFIKVGNTPGDDQVILTRLEKSGATVENPEYAQLIRELVAQFAFDG